MKLELENKTPLIIVNGTILLYIGFIHNLFISLIEIEFMYIELNSPIDNMKHCDTLAIFLIIYYKKYSLYSVQL